MTPAKTKKFFTHCRGRSETTTAVRKPIGRAIAPSRAARSREHGAEPRRHLVDLGVGELGEARKRQHLARGPRRLGKRRGHPRLAARRAEQRLGGGGKRGGRGGAHPELGEPAPPRSGTPAATRPSPPGGQNSGWAGMGIG